MTMRVWLTLGFCFTKAPVSTECGPVQNMTLTRNTLDGIVDTEQRYRCFKG